MPPGLEGLANIGAIGIVLAWFMIRMEPRMQHVETALDRLSRALMVKLIAENHADGEIHRQAEAILRELDAKEAGKAL